MGKKAFVVLETRGAWSDMSVEAVAVYLDESQAQTDVQLRSASERKILEQELARARSKADRRIVKEDRETFGRRYHYEQVPLLDDVPPELRGDGSA